MVIDRPDKRKSKEAGVCVDTDEDAMDINTADLPSEVRNKIVGIMLVLTFVRTLTSFSAWQCKRCRTSWAPYVRSSRSSLSELETNQAM
jgi:hypothetical protein